MRTIHESFLPGLLLLSMLAFGCASKPEKPLCTQRDWYELGRHDGAQGSTLDRTKIYEKECGSEFGDHYETIYQNGRNAGLIEFCQPDNAFELGRMGIAYLYVCPATMETPFISGYRKGEQARMLEIKKRDIDAQIDSLSQRLQILNDDSDEKKQLTGKLDELRQNRAANERELDRVSKDL